MPLKVVGMNRFYFFVFFFFFGGWSNLEGVAQTNSTDLTQNLAAAWKKFEESESFKHGLVGFVVQDVQSGQILFAQSEQKKMAPASTLKVITSAAAMELLSPNYTFKTNIYRDGSIQNGILKGDIWIDGGFDPSLGSFRFPETKPDQVLNRIVSFLNSAGIQSIEGNIRCAGNPHEIPDSWIWQDLGNYYGATGGSFNWRENQFDLFLKSGPQKGDPVQLVKTEPEMNFPIENNLLAGAVGSGDQAYAYHRVDRVGMTLKGTIPAQQTAFKISASIAQPAVLFLEELSVALMKAGIEVNGQQFPYSGDLPKLSALQKLGVIESPPLKDLSFWFLQKSVNLYGECFLLALHHDQKWNPLAPSNGSASNDPAKQLTNWFASTLNQYTLTATTKAFNAASVHLEDGSGLSPQNTITPLALNQVLLYAYHQSWYAAWFKGFPTIGGFTMKSGTISGARCYAGYLQAKSGKKLAFTIMSNRFNGPASAVSTQMFQFLEAVKKAL